LTVAEMGV